MVINAPRFEIIKVTIESSVASLSSRLSGKRCRLAANNLHRRQPTTTRKGFRTLHFYFSKFENMNPEITIAGTPFRSRKFCSYTVDFFDTMLSVTVTSTASVVKKWLYTTIYLRKRRFLQDCHVVGLAVQWNPRNGNDPPADTLQLCVGSRCLIYQLSHASTVPRLLYRFLNDTTNTFVGIWNSQDEKKLEMERGLEIHRLLDLRMYAVDEDGYSLSSASVGEIVKEYLDYEDVYLDKTVSTSEWDDYYLDDDQVMQASVKAHVAFEIGKNMGAWKF